MAICTFIKTRNTKKICSESDSVNKVYKNIHVTYKLSLLTIIEIAIQSIALTKSQIFCEFHCNVRETNL